VHANLAWYRPQRGLDGYRQTTLTGEIAMLRKRRFIKDNVIKVTFVVEDSGAGTVFLAGDFNDWQATAMKRRDGNWRATVALEPGREYQFRYLIGEDRWMNDPQADGYVRNPFGEENSFVRT